MTKENVNQLMMSLSGKIPEEKAILLKQKLENASDNAVANIASMNLHNPTHILLFSIFLGVFGVDRFMIGDTGVGIAKLLLGWLTCGIWPIIDILYKDERNLEREVFITYKRAKEKNCSKIFLAL